MWHLSSLLGATWNRNDSEKEAPPEEEDNELETELDDGFELK